MVTMNESKRALIESTICLQHFYDVGEVAWRNAYGTIYRGRQLSFERPVLIWLFDRLLEKNPPQSVIDRVRTAAAHSAQLEHPSNVKVLDYGVMDDVPFVVMERFSGPSLPNAHSRCSTRPYASARTTAPSAARG